MSHPFSKNRRVILAYAICWLLVSGAHLALLLSIARADVAVAITDALVYNTVFALIGMAIFYATAYTGLDKRFGDIIFNHILAAVAFVGIWLLTSYLLSEMLFSIFNIASPDNASWLRVRIPIGLAYYIVLSLMFYLIKSNETGKAAKQDILKMESQLRESQLQALKSQINPHFLFNSLNSISFLVKSNPDKAREMLSVLSEYFRYSLKQQSNTALLGDELNHCRKYLEIEKIRFGNKLLWTETIENNTDAIPVPAMILQPIYENAVKHGVYESEIPVSINTHISLHTGYALIEIENNFDPEAPVRKGEGVGLKNAGERLKLMFGADDLLETSITNSVFTVKISIPIPRIV